MEFHRQPDGYTCGASCLVTARMLTDPALAQTAQSDPRWRALVLAAHRSLTRSRDEAGRWQVPWPRFLGTPPWTLARAMSRTATAPPYRWRTVRFQPSRLRELLATASDERPLPVYVGSRLLPRHVILVTHADEQATTLYNPATGRTHRFLASQWPGPGHRWTTVWGVLG